MKRYDEKTDIRFLVTGVGGPAGVNAVRLLKTQSDVTVMATDIDPLAAGQFFADEFKTSARVDDPAYGESLRALVRDWKIDVVVPTVAEELVIIQAALTGVDVDLVVSPRETVEACHDKRKMYVLVAQALPDDCVRWQTADQAPWDAEQYFVKPAFGRGGRGCRLVDAEERKRMVRASNAAELIVMDVLPGTEWTVDAYVAGDGSIPMVVPRERIQLSGGISMKGRTVKQSAVIEASLRVLKILPCLGPVCIQWKADTSGRPKFVEMNPRMSGAATITAAAGANLMACLVAELRSGTVASVDWKEVTVVRYFDEKTL